MLLSHLGYLVNNERIAKTIVTLIRERDSPTSFCSLRPNRRESGTNKVASEQIRIIDAAGLSENDLARLCDSVSVEGHLGPATRRTHERTGVEVPSPPRKLWKSWVIYRCRLL